jgi:hypothetical protein
MNINHIVTIVGAGGRVRYLSNINTTVIEVDAIEDATPFITFKGAETSMDDYHKVIQGQKVLMLIQKVDSDGYIDQ